MFGIVPALQQRIIGLGFWPEALKNFMAHPAGPFTSKLLSELTPDSILLGANFQMDDNFLKHRRLQEACAECISELADRDLRYWLHLDEICHSGDSD